MNISLNLQTHTSQLSKLCNTYITLKASAIHMGTLMLVGDPQVVTGDNIIQQLIESNRQINYLHYLSFQIIYIIDRSSTSSIYLYLSICIQIIYIYIYRERQHIYLHRSVHRLFLGHQLIFLRGSLSAKGRPDLGDHRKQSRDGQIWAMGFGDYDLF